MAMNLHGLFAISWASRLFIQAAGKQSLKQPPAQYLYDAASATSTVQHGGCTVTSWDELYMDSDGMSGPPWVSFVNCSAGASYVTSGVATHGDFQVWVHYGQISLDGSVRSRMGESFWIASGARVSLNITGSAYVAGARFELDSSAEEAIFTASFMGPKHRHYSLMEAALFQKNSSLQHDPHICNGSSPSMDFVFGSHTLVDPASVVVMNCAPASTPQENFVWSHFHPSGALYMPFSGEICFATTKVRCVGPGTARWTSANLQYYEYFRKINTTSPGADAVRDLARVPREKCQYPNVFAVTNFDGPAAEPGVPNFGDWPVSAHGSLSAVGIGPWGIFPTMTLQATKVIVKSSSVLLDDKLGSDEEEDHSTHSKPPMTMNLV